MHVCVHVPVVIQARARLSSLKVSATHAPKPPQWAMASNGCLKRFSSGGHELVYEGGHGKDSSDEEEGRERERHGSEVVQFSHLVDMHVF